MDPAAADIARARALESVEDQLSEDRAQLDADAPDELDFLDELGDDAPLDDSNEILSDRWEVAARLRRHKKQVRYHREQTRLLAQRLEALDDQLAAFGITLEVNTQPKGGHSGSINGGEAETI